MDKKQLSYFIKKKALELGFLSCGFSEATFLEEEAPRLEKWLKKNAHGKMSYMENHFDKRLDPTKLVEGTRTIVSLSYNYYPLLNQKKGTYKISKYAYGQDYHNVLRKKLKKLLRIIQEEQICSGRVFVDSAPIMEKAWAKKSRLGWIGKNTNLISKKIGSFYFLCEIFLDIPLEYDEEYILDHCGTCTRCIEACPTNALTPYKLDADKCISYFTIELKDNIPKSNSKQIDDWIFGCDICQDVCPWNKFSQPHNEPKFHINEFIKEMDKKDWEDMTEGIFNDNFSNSSLKRAGFSGLRKNIENLNSYLKK